MANTPSSAALVDAIAALNVLHGKNHTLSVICKPIENEAPPFSPDWQDYVLSFDEENRLAGYLAFLAYPSNDNSRIPAVCVEQSLDKKHLNARVALNRSDPGDNEGSMRAIVDGMQRIFGHMSQSDADPKRKDRIFQAVVSMCSRRILTRLGLKFGRGSKSPLDALLQDASKALRCKKRALKEEQKEMVEAFLSETREITKHIAAWKNYQTPAALAVVVKSIFDLDKHPKIDVTGVLKHLTNQDMNPNLKQSICNTLAKVSRYREVAKYLYRCAKDREIFRHMRAVPVDLPESFFARPAPPSSSASGSDFTSVVSKINGRARPEVVKEACRILNITPHEADEQFYKVRNRAAGEGAKIHAEVQLLYFYEMTTVTAATADRQQQRVKRRPRVVRSSKDACWMCNSLIRLHGGMHTPRCHGVLYPGWRLPEVATTTATSSSPPLNKLSARLTAALQEELSRCVVTLLERRERTAYPMPFESTATVWPRSVSTVYLPLPSAPSAPSAETLTAPVAILTTAASAQRKAADSPAAAEDKNPPQATRSSGSGLDTVVEETSSESLFIHSSGDAAEPRILREDERHTAHLRHGESSAVYRAGRLEIQVEYEGPQGVSASSTTARQPQSLASELVCTITRLGTQDARAAAAVIDAEAIEGEVARTMDGEGCVYVSAGGAVVRLCREEARGGD